MSARADVLVRLAGAATPAFLGFLGVILLASPIRLAGGLLPTPIIPLIIVYFWSLYSPGHLPAVSVFLMGLLHDLLSGGPIGMWPTAYLVMQQIAISQKAYFLGRELRVVSIGFAVAAFVVSLILWFVMSLMTATLLPIGGLLWQMLLTSAFFPLFAMAFGRLHRRVVIEV
ncbi:MAG: rod shape-determining protein MreD [Parvularculaceae bacterium]|nr:rod shape-determining protein MreD [Parvularculaceae bacterium]